MHVFGMLFCGLTSLACTRSALAQDAIASRKVAQAERIMGALTIDGSLQDSAWQRVPISRDFEELSPQPGTSPQFDTEVRFAYDDAALYIGARMWDDAPDSVLHQLSERDRMANTDEFGIWFSTFDDGLNAVRFSTTPDGIQVDEQLSPNNNDQSWDAVWDVACQIDSAGWTAEFRIPWMAFRFPKQAEQAWGMNMYRTLRRQREESVWNPDGSDPEAAQPRRSASRNLQNRSAFAAQPVSLFEHLRHRSGGGNLIDVQRWDGHESRPGQCFHPRHDPHSRLSGKWSPMRWY